MRKINRRKGLGGPWAGKMSGQEYQMRKERWERVDRWEGGQKEWQKRGRRVDERSRQARAD